MAVGGQQFEIEALEPRILLSSDTVGSSVALMEQSTPTTIEERSELAVIPLEQSLTYDPAGQVNQIFEGVGTEDANSSPASQSVVVRGRTLANEVKFTAVYELPLHQLTGF